MSLCHFSNPPVVHNSKILANVWKGRGCLAVALQPAGFACYLNGNKLYYWYAEGFACCIKITHRPDLAPCAVVCRPPTYIITCPALIYCSSLVFTFYTILLPGQLTQLKISSNSLKYNLLKVTSQTYEKVTSSSICSQIKHFTESLFCCFALN